MKYSLALSAIACATTVAAGPLNIFGRQYGASSGVSSNMVDYTAGNPNAAQQSSAPSSTYQAPSGGYNSTNSGNNNNTSSGLADAQGDRNGQLDNFDASGSSAGISDTDILNLALTLEHLENVFYQQGLANFTASDFQSLGVAPDFYERLQTIASHEQDHVDFLTAALGGQAVQECVYTFPVSDPASFLRQAAIFESFGASAYQGAAPLIASKATLGNAASILSVEARHTSYLRAQRDVSPFPHVFDVPLSPSAAYTAATRYFVSCPSSNPEIAVKVSPLLTPVDSMAMLMEGSTVELRPSAGFNAQGQTLYAAFPTALGYQFSPASESSNGYTTTIPGGVSGQAYAILVNQNGVVSDETTVAGPAVLMVGGN